MRRSTRRAFSFPRAACVTSLLLLLSTVLPLQAQEPEKLIRMAGSAVDSIPGGPPSVLIREVTAEEAVKREKRNAFDIDMIKATAYINLAFRTAVSNKVVVGVEAQTTPGILEIFSPDEDFGFPGDPDEGKGWGIGLDGQYFFGGKRRKGFHLAGGVDFYSVYHEGEYQEVVAMSADLGFRIFIGATYTDIKLGAEFFPKELSGTDGSDEGITYVALVDNSNLLPHLSVRHGLLW